MTSTTWYDPSGSAPTNPWVAGGAYSTARDYAKLLRALLGGTFITDMTGFTQPRTTGLPRVFVPGGAANWRSEEHTTELQHLMRLSYAVVCLYNKEKNAHHHTTT